MFTRASLLCWLALAGVCSAQPLTNRVANTTLKMPAAPPAFGYRTVNAFGTLTFTDPLAIASPPGETNRLFIVEQRGRIAVITNLAAPTRTVFLDISARVQGGTPSDERGLLGLAFHPGYATNGFFFVYYSSSATTRVPGGTNAPHQRLSRFRVSGANPNAADPASEATLLLIFDEASNHNGGDLHFGPDGYLYVSLGDEGNANDSLNNSQRITKDFWSSMLRLDVDVPPRPASLLPNPHPANTNSPGGVINYRVPADNPFIGVTTFNGQPVNASLVRTEFFAVGLRNPWRFSFDEVTGLLYCGDVGQDAWEEIDIIEKGGNYGWAFRDATNAGPKSASAPAGFTSRLPIQTYRHGTATNQGNSVTGGLVYRGQKISQLYGAYVFSDYVSGNVWALRYNGSNTVPFVRLTSNPSVAGFGVDPRNGDILLADQGADTIKRLEYNTNVISGTPLPPTLADTGAFADLATLTPNAGIVPYDLNAPFWSDDALKTRWFSVPNTNLNIGFSRDSNWSFPTGSVWIKHFELQLTNGVSESARRLETRFIVRNTNGVYGVTYRWGDSLTNATLVTEEGMDETFTVYDGASPRAQVWHYPSRTECLLCHTPVGGFALGFNTAQLNRDFDYGVGNENQIATLDRAGYLSTNAAGLHTLRALAHPTNSTVSLEYRVHSYLAANCAQCHQPGGAGLGFWDARITTPMSAAGIIEGVLRDAEENSDNRVIKPNSLPHSVLLSRVSALDRERMPPLATRVLDATAINLISEWITNGLAGYQSFADWQIKYFGSTNAPEAAASADADQDGASNHLEYLTGTDPKTAGDSWRIGIRRNGDQVEIFYPRVANRGFEAQFTMDLNNANSWRPLDVAENRPWFAATNGEASIPVLLTNSATIFYRVKVFEPLAALPALWRRSIHSRSHQGNV